MKKSKAIFVLTALGLFVIVTIFLYSWRSAHPDPRTSVVTIAELVDKRFIHGNDFGVFKYMCNGRRLETYSIWYDSMTNGYKFVCQCDKSDPDRVRLDPYRPTFAEGEVRDTAQAEITNVRMNLLDSWVEFRYIVDSVGYHRMQYIKKEELLAMGIKHGSMIPARYLIANPQRSILDLNSHTE